MAVFNPLTQKIIVSALDSDKPKYAVPAPVMLALMLSAFGFASITIGTVAPGDARTLWYNKDTNKFRRYNPLTAAWADLIPSQWFMHTLQIAFRSAGVEGIVDDADKMPFFDVSADETKMISFADMKASLGVSGWVQYAANTLVARTQMVEFELPFSYNDFMIRATFDAYLIGGAGNVRFNPRVRGVYPTNALIDLSVSLSGTFGANVTQQHAQQFSGDRGDLTGMIMRENGWSWNNNVASDQRRVIPVTNRISKVRFMVPDGGVPITGGPPYSEPKDDDAWGFEVGSVFKLFVR